MSRSGYSIQEQLEWYRSEIDRQRKILDRKRQEFFSADADLSRLEREANLLFKKALEGAK